jgi:hypothetical protein
LQKVFECKAVGHLNGSEDSLLGKFNRGGIW